MLRIYQISIPEMQSNKAKLSNRLFYVSFTLGIVTCEWLHDLINQIDCKLKPHELVFFIDSYRSNNTEEKNLIIQKLSNGIPNTVINLDEITVSNQFSKESVRHTKHVSLYVSLVYTDCNKYEKIINSMVNFSHGPFPQYLMISRNQNCESLDYISTVLKYAWSENFLDFSILVLRSSNETAPKLYNLNPFYNIVNVENFTLDSVIFPKKLTDVNGYPMKVPTRNIGTRAMMEKLENGSWKIEGTHYPFTDFALKAMNFTIDPAVNLSTSSFSEFKNALYNLARNRDINAYLFPVSFRLIEDRSMMYLREDDCEAIAVIVPVIQRAALQIPLHTIFDLLILITLVLALAFTLRYFRVVALKWTVIDIVQLMMGITTRTDCNKMISKSIYISIILASMFYTNDLYMSIVDIKLEDREVRLNDLESIDESGLPLVAFSSDYDNIFKRISNQNLQNIMTRTRRVNEVKELYACLQALSNGKKIICIINRSNFEFLIASGEIKNSPLMKIAGQTLFCDPLAYFFEPRSPYAEKFMSIQRMIRESGLWYKIKDKKILPPSRNGFGKVNIIMTLRCTKSLYLVLVVGYLVSFVSFCFELLYGRSRRRRRSVTGKLVHVRDHNSFIKISNKVNEPMMPKLHSNRKQGLRLQRIQSTFPKSDVRERDRYLPFRL